MNSTDTIAAALLTRDNFQLRALLLTLQRQYPTLQQLPAPDSTNPITRSVAAGIIEALAQERGQAPPDWTATATEPLAEPLFLVPSADHMRRLRELCRAESPEPLKRRGMCALPNFLSIA